MMKGCIFPSFRIQHKRSMPLPSGRRIEDFLVSNLILPIGSLIYTLFCTSKYGWGWDNYLKEVNTGNGLKVPGKIRFYCKWILPLVTLFIIVNGLISVFNK